MGDAPEAPGAKAVLQEEEKHCLKLSTFQKWNEWIYGLGCSIGEGHNAVTLPQPEFECLLMEQFKGQCQRTSGSTRVQKVKASGRDKDQVELTQL